MRAGWGHEVGCLFCLFLLQFFLLLFSDFRFQFSALTIVDCRSQRRGNLGMVYRMTPVFWFVIFISVFITLFGIGYCWVQISVERRMGAWCRVTERPRDEGSSPQPIIPLSRIYFSRFEHCRNLTYIQGPFSWVDKRFLIIFGEFVRILPNPISASLCLCHSLYG